MVIIFFIIILRISNILVVQDYNNYNNYKYIKKNKINYSIFVYII
jgi:hypothetical protein